MSKKLLELATEKLTGQLLSDFENFYTFLKSENMTLTQGYKCYKFKYKGKDVGKIRIDDNSVGCTVLIGSNGNHDKYVEEQATELTDIFTKALEHKCVYCRVHGCTTHMAMMTLNIAGINHDNICVNAFGDFRSFSFISIADSMQNMMWITPWIRPESLHHYNKIPVSIDTVKSAFYIKKAYVINKM